MTNRQWTLALYAVAVLLGIAGVWVAISTRMTASMVAPALIAVFGGVSLLITLQSTAAELPSNAFAVYTNAWRMLRRSRALILVFAAPILVNLLDGVLRRALLSYVSRDALGGVRVLPFFRDDALGSRLLDGVGRALISAERSMFKLFVPGIDNDGLLLTLVVLLGFIWIIVKQRRFASDRRCAAGIAMVKLLIWPCIAAVVWQIAVTWTGLREIMMLLNGASSTSGTAVTVSPGMSIPSNQFAGHRMMPSPYEVILTIAAGALFFSVVNGFLVGGMLGCLRRFVNGEHVAFNELVQDALYYFKPMFGIFAAIAVLEALPILIGMLSPQLLLGGVIGIIALLARFVLGLAPVACVVSNLDASGSVAQAVEVCRGKWRDVVGFIAMGCVLLLLPPWLLLSVEYQFNGNSIVILLISSTFYVFARPFMLIALWELYAKLTQEDSRLASSPSNQ